MKIKTPLLILVAVLLVSCASKPALSPTVTSALTPMATKTLSPTEIFTPAPTATDSASPTPTKVVLPNWLQPFTDGGYDKKFASGFLYMMVSDGNTHYANNITGITFNNLQIYSWMTDIAYYDEQGVLHTDGIILDGVCRVMGQGSSWGTMVDTWTTLSNPVCPSLAFFKTTRSEIERKSVGEHFMVKGTEIEVKNQDKTKIFAGIFPIVNGTPQPVEISGIGKVLPIIAFQEYLQDVQWTK